MINSEGEPTEASDSAKSFHKMIDSFTGMELSDLCLKFQHELQKEDADLDLTKLLDYGNDAVSTLLVSKQNYNIPCFSKHVDDGNPNRSHSAFLFIASILNMMGIACSKLKNYDGSLKYLNWAKNNLDKLERDASCCVGCCSVIFLENQFELYKVKFDTEKKTECPVHMEKILKIKNKTMEKGCVELGHANKDVASAYQLGDNSAAALPYLVKALEIYETRLAHDSPEILPLRARIIDMYSEEGDYNKALEQNQLYLTVYEKVGNNSLLLYTKVQRGGLLILAGEYEKAITVIEEVTTRTDTKRMLLATALQYLAQAKFLSAKFYRQRGLMSILKSSSKILDNIEINPDDQLQRGDFLENYERLFSVIGQTCDFQQATSLLEDVLGKLKMKFGETCLEVGYCYHRLGSTYVKSEKFDLAAKNFTWAKDVLNECLGPTHLKTLNSHISLAQALAKMQSYDRAIEHQEKVIEHLKGLGQSEQNSLVVAIQTLEQMKKDKSCDPRMGVAPSEDDEEPSCSSPSTASTGIKQAKSKRRGR